MSDPDQAAFIAYPDPAMVSALCLSKSGSAKYSCCKLQVGIKILNIKLKYHSPHTDWGRYSIKTKHKVLVAHNFKFEQKLNFKN